MTKANQPTDISLPSEHFTRGRHLAGQGKCITCNHEHRDEIEDLLSKGRTASSVAKRYGLNPVSVSKHWRNHAKPNGQGLAHDLVRKSERLTAIAEKLIDQAEKEPSLEKRTEILDRSTQMLGRAVTLAARLRGHLSTSADSLVRNHLGMSIESVKVVMNHWKDAVAVTESETVRVCVATLKAWNEAHPDQAEYVERPKPRRSRELG